MESVKASSLTSLSIRTAFDRTQFRKPMFLNFHFGPTTRSSFSLVGTNQPKFKVFTTISSTDSTETKNPPDAEFETRSKDDKFDWYAQWYPVMPVCDLDKRVPHAKKVIGLDVVLWWDRNECAWKVFEDSCPHRLAPLSEGRIDQRGRLQCVYHGWCFNGSGDCKFIPQAPPDGPPVHTFKKACVGVYPSTVQNDIVWFWPNTDPQYKDIIMERKPPYISEIDDPSYTKLMGNREIPYGYEVLIENLMDPAHVPYAHYGIMQMQQPKNRVKADREGGRPLELIIERLDINGFEADQDERSRSKFFPPCVFYAYTDSMVDQTNGSASSAGTKKERKIIDAGPTNWQKACFVPTKSDALVVGFRKWLNRYAGGQVDWRGKYSGALPPTPPREQLMDRYRSHVVNCRSCSVAYKGLNVLEVVLQVASVASIGIVAAVKQGAMSAAARTTIVLLAVLFYASSRWLAHFIYKNFHYHDYSHALR
ncbi:protochlorophyllide-dependent translocon component 52, chloroplastic-like isoform X2 [Carya illinoinensis]|uniref:Rieske domain-containing protein n=2 Tax=Carya illinoinensis TaxID=32201 RepID=A0A922D502_CARIL|nr:protochlorophyllide-dependent translocon component 52, chloroplastic-like isoform X2 [Carya illinoinensis]KAG6679542.1 hypothetical protein I3842_14G137400 [Carya illinoinensis]